VLSTHRKIYPLASAILLIFALLACGQPTKVNPDIGTEGASQETGPLVTPTSAQPIDAAEVPPQNADVDRAYTLVTGGDYGGLIFVGVGGEIDGVINPELTANVGDTVQITLINGDGIMHDLTIEELSVMTEVLTEKGSSSTVTFTVEEDAEYIYFCAQPGHRAAGMFGKLIVGEPVSLARVGENIVRNPADLPPPITRIEPEIVVVELTAIEVEGQLADGTTYSYFTFDGQIPGPMIRVRVGDTVELHLKNDTASTLAHSIDLHAVTGPGGGAVYTSTNPGEEHVFSFKALKPGAYVYHCATPSVAHHIASGMYGLIIVEPEEGLPPVDREFYVMQGEIYTEQPFGTLGHVDFSHEAMLNEDPEYIVFNGMAAGLALDDNAMRANVGETVRIFFGVGGPNFTSSFHVIGEIFDRVYTFASFTSEPMLDVQTTLVPPGGAAVVEFGLEVPGRYILVDHALSRLERGLVGFLYVDGEENTEIFSGTETEGSGH
jgi:nitrite reductase (NO-forming)